MAKRDEYVTPVDHTVMSGVATTTAETAKGGVQGILGGLLSGPLIVGGIAAAISVAFGIGGALTAFTGLNAAGATVLTLGAGLSAVGTLAGVALGVGALGALAGGAAMLFIPHVGAALVGLGSLIGLTGGWFKGDQRVSRERSAAAQINTELSALQTCAQMNSVAANPAYAAFPAQGSAMNQAAKQIHVGAANAQHQGSVAQEAALARA